MNLVPAPIFVKDRAGRYLACNRAFEVFIGKRGEEMIGKTAFELFPHELAKIYHDADERLLKARGNQTYEASVQYADGTYRDVQFH
ncbi:MAG: PAS domain-containing protein, partial [Lamprobacter sp.]|uniref:PAS domain-containing protein n=1 Tax=Lamprobacter sp. TaxID=3100796 RepID=UPI002B26258A